LIVRLVIRFLSMNLRQLQQFLAVAETLNFRKAAERLHMAQPPLSVSIKRLEEDLGTPLFLRERRGLRLTSAGESILLHARQISFHAAELRRAALDAAGGVGGVLKIGFIGSATYTLFPRALPAFRARYPRVTLDLRERTTREILREVENGELDLGLVRYPLIEDSAVSLLPVEHDRLVVALPKGSALAMRKRLQVKDLEHEPFVIYAASAALNLRAQVLSVCRAAGFSPTIVQEAVQVQTILSLVESGLGVALVPSLSESQGTRGLVFRTLGNDARLAVAIAVATHPLTEPPAARRFRELLVELAGDRKSGRS
jgi:DNA-binding transcriptional LysR family regulator